jgi:beta-lactamase class A
VRTAAPLDRVAALTALSAIILIGIFACSVSASTQHFIATPSPPTMTSTPTATVTFAPMATPTSIPSPTAAATLPGRCPDPYPDGVPYTVTPGQNTVTPGQTIHLRPTGVPQPIARYDPVPLISDQALEAVIRDALGQDIDHYGVVVKRLDDGAGVSINAGGVYYAASLYKVWVMLEAFQQEAEGLLSFHERYVVSDYYAGLSLNPDELALCSQVTVEEALQAMMRVSDNVAANMMLERVGTANTNNMLRQFGLAVSGVQNGGDVYTSANGMELLLEAIARHQAVSPEASDEMLALLASETLDSRIPALLPPGTRIAHKTGSWDNATNDAGIVYSPNATYVIVVLSDLGYDVDADSQIAGLSRAVYDYFNPN